MKTQRKIPFGDLGRQYEEIQKDIDAAVHRVLKSGWYILGKEGENFEKFFAEYSNAQYAVGVGSGTEALHLALVASGIKSGDQVITVSNTAVPTISAISFAQGTPVFVDINPDTYCIDASRIEEKITEKTKVLLPVHLYGHPCDMDKILKIAQKYNLIVIEDCAQSHGAKIGEKSIGTFGHYGCFSFYPSKNLGAMGDAGAIVTNSPADYEKLVKLRNYGQSKRYYHDIEGFNSRLDEMQAAILSTKLQFLQEWTSRRRFIANLYRDNIANEKITVPDEDPAVLHVYHLYVIRCEKRDELRNFLASNGVGTQIHYPVPCHLQNAYRHLGLETGSLPFTEKYANQVLSLPNYPELSDDDILYVCELLNKF